MSQAARKLDHDSIVVANGLSPSSVLELIVGRAHSHVCQLGRKDFDLEYQSAELMVQSPDMFFKDPVACTLNPKSSMRPFEVNSLSLSSQFRNISEKGDNLSKVAQFAQRVGAGKVLSDELQLVADEMFTNAIFNAPYSTGEMNPGRDRFNAEACLPFGHTARLFCAKEDNRLVLGCFDSFGSLNLDKYVARMKQVCDLGPDKAINFGAGGAGLGSHLIFMLANSLFLGVRPGRQTVFCAIFYLGLSNKQRSMLPKNIHCIWD